MPSKSEWARIWLEAHPDAFIVGDDPRKAGKTIQDRWNELLHVMLDNQRITRDNKMIDDPRYAKEPQ